MKITKFDDIPEFIGVVGAYKIDVPLAKLDRYLKEIDEDYGLELNPDFQRGRVWTEEQQIKYLEFFFSGGLSGNELYFNSPEFNSRKGDDIDTSKVICVDGLQRITATLRFLNNEIPIFGSYYKEFDDVPRTAMFRIQVYINGLTNKKDLLRWYIELNEGGTPHTEEEINRVKNMIKELEEGDSSE